MTTTEWLEREVQQTVDPAAVEELAKSLEYASWKGFNQSESEFEKGYKHAMKVAAERVKGLISARAK